MKISKNGDVKLEKGELRIHNHIFREEKGYIKIFDLSNMISWRLNSDMLGIGVYLKTMIKGCKDEDEKRRKACEEYLHLYAVAFNLALSAIPDVELSEKLENGTLEKGDDAYKYNYLFKVIDDAKECINRHPEFYGIEKNPSDEKNEKDLEAVKDMENLKDEILKSKD